MRKFDTFAISAEIRYYVLVYVEFNFGKCNVDFGFIDFTTAFT